MSESNFDLVEIVRSIVKRKVFVLGFTAICIVAGIILSLVSPTVYEGRSTFIIKSPTLVDRNYLFGQKFYQNKVVFATEDEIDNVETVSKSDTVMAYLVDKYKLQDVYKTGTREDAIHRARKDFKFKRNDTKNIEIRFKASTPELAANLSNGATEIIAALFNSYFTETNKQISTGLQSKIADLDSTIDSLESQIASLRAENNIYSEMMPGRGAKEYSNVNAHTVSPAAAAGMEKLQRVSVLKDRLVLDRADYFSLLNEYSMVDKTTGVNLLHVVQRAGGSAVWPIMWVVIIICTLGGLIFSSILVTIGAYYRTRIK